jgi:hypothetical protein
MFLFSGNGDFSTNDEVRQILADVQTMYDRMTPESRHRVAIVGGFHFTFTDDGAVLKSRLLRGILRVFGRLQIEGRRQLAVTAYCVRTFFDAYLKDSGCRTPAAGCRSELVIASPLYPELKILD